MGPTERYPVGDISPDGEEEVEGESSGDAEGRISDKHEAFLFVGLQGEDSEPEVEGDAGSEHGAG